MDIKVGLLGPGSWAQQGHLPALAAAGAVVSVVCGRDADRARDAAQKAGIERATTDWRGVIADGELDALVVTTPPVAHAEPVAAALEAGLPVMSESPLAMTLADARALAALARERGVVTGYTRPRPFNFNGRAVVEHLAQGRIGVLRRAVFELSGHPWLRATPEQTWRVRADGGPTPLAGLAAGLLVELCGPIAQIDGVLSISDGDSNRAPDELVAHARSESGCLVAIEAGWSRAPRMQVVLHGTEGSILWDLGAAGTVSLATDQGWQVIDEPRKEEFSAPAEFVAAVAAKRQHALGFDRAVHELELVEALAVR